MKNGDMPVILASAAATTVHIAWLLPFAILLLLIALGPILFEHWWHHNYPKAAVILGILPIGYYLLGLHEFTRVLHVAHEYVSFIALIGSLFVVAGGIHIIVKGEAKPLINVVFLFIGAVLANFIGTTGASMLMIRPWIRMNRYRITGFHIVFFIFIISNVGGCLTPIGDPPLFLGYLKGVPFLWVLEHCWIAWLIAVGLLLAIFYVLDVRNSKRPPKEISEKLTASETWRFEGFHNLFFLGVILAAVVASKHLPPLVPDALMIAAALGSYFSTPKQIHHANAFNFGPIKEVAWLFVGIFATMMPALDYIQVHASEFGLHSPGQFYWATGVLSAFLDNAPTYLTFLAAAMADQGLNINNPAQVLTFVESDSHLLAAISLAAVFFGACTYIGNGPNFMVKNIAQEFGAKPPTFFGYLFRYAVPILVPILALIAILFFSPWRIF